MERNINYTVGLDEISPKSPQFAGVQGEHNVTAIKISFSDEFSAKLQELPRLYDYIQFRIDYTDTEGKVVYGEVKDISEIAEPFYLTRVMTKSGGNATAVLKISCIDHLGTQKEFYTGVMRFYFDPCPSVILSDDDQGSILSPIVNQARIYRNEAYDCARTSVEAENNIKSMTEENRSLNEQTENNTQTVLEASQKAIEIEEKIDNANEILTDCDEAASLARDAAKGVVTIEQNRQVPLKISVMTKEEYGAATRPDPDGASTLDFIEDEVLADLIYPVGSIYMSVNDTDPQALFGGNWKRIKDRFLLSCGDTYPAGSTGGEAEHTLTVLEMPRHNHGISTKFNSAAGSTDLVMLADENIGTQYTYENGAGPIHHQGESKPHNNMPPYLAVYMWQRVS